MDTPNQNTDLTTWLLYLEKLHPQTIDLGLERITQVAQRMQINLAAVKIIVGGTNGKGSTCAMLESIYAAAGYQTGLYTSPHLVRFNERIRINKQEVDDQAIVTALQIVEQARETTSLTYFEYTTLAALYLFQQACLDVVILEVGLGGRLDAVNIVDADCAVVTSVDIDHVDYLGTTREQIGWEKAHIFRPHQLAIVGDPQPPQTLLDYATSIAADLRLFQRDFNYSADKQQWAFAGRTQRRNALPWPALRGANQLLNASCALAVVESLYARLPVQIQAIKEGLLQLNLPGRFQIIPGQPTIILDVAHNPHAVATLAHNLDHMAYYPYTYAVVGMLKDKDCLTSLQHMGKRIDYWYCASLPGERGQSAEQLAQVVRQAIPVDKEGFPQVKTFATPAQALQQAQADMAQADRLVVFGSFLTVSDVLQQLGRA